MLASAPRWRSARASFNLEHEKLSKQMMPLCRLLPSPSSSPPRSPWDSLRDFQQIVPKALRALGETERPVSHRLSTEGGEYPGLARGGFSSAVSH